MPNGITTQGRPGYSSAGVAWLAIEKRIPHDTEALSFDVKIEATYELFFKDGEVFVVKNGTDPNEPGEIVYSEIFNEED